MSVRLSHLVATICEVMQSSHPADVSLQHIGINIPGVGGWGRKRACEFVMLYGGCRCRAARSVYVMMTAKSAKTATFIAVL